LGTEQRTETTFFWDDLTNERNRFGLTTFHRPLVFDINPPVLSHRLDSALRPSRFSSCNQPLGHLPNLGDSPNQKTSVGYLL